MTRHTGRYHGRFQEIHHIINARLLLFSQPEALTACSNRPSCTSSRLPLGLAITDNWSRTRSADWSISVMFANGLKRRVSPSRYTPPCSHTKTCSHPPCRTPRQSPGVQHAADKWLYQPGFTGPGCSTDRHVVVGVIHPLKEDIDKRQLVTVGGCQQACRCQGLSATNGIRLATLKLSAR